MRREKLLEWAQEELMASAWESDLFVETYVGDSLKVVEVETALSIIKDVLDERNFLTRLRRRFRTVDPDAEG